MNPIHQQRSNNGCNPEGGGDEQCLLGEVESLNALLLFQSSFVVRHSLFDRGQPLAVHVHSKSESINILGVRLGLHFGGDPGSEAKLELCQVGAELVPADADPLVLIAHDPIRTIENSGVKSAWAANVLDAPESCWAIIST